MFSCSDSCSPEPSDENAYLSSHIERLRLSFQYWTGSDLLDCESAPVIAARTLYEAPFALLSHGREDDPIINYANRTAQRLFEMDWNEFTKLPSRLSAEMPVQQERDALLKRVTENGYIDDYSGIRVSSTGKRFLIDHATVWTVRDHDGNHYGQAAMFNSWSMLKGE
ncbi:MAG: MEKHLA domain-containing protein [Mariprofundus sp.]